LLIVIAVVWAYSNSLQGSFHFDDVHSIVNKPSLQSLDPKAIWKENNSFRFIGFYSFALNMNVNGVQGLAGWHAVNIILHGLCGIFLYFLLRQLTKNSSQWFLPLTATLLFVLHPLGSEPLNYIQARHVLFYSLFTLTASLCTVFWIKAETPNQKLYASVGLLVSIILGALSKEVALFYLPFACFITWTTLSFRNAQPINLKHPMCIFFGLMMILAILGLWYSIDLSHVFSKTATHPMIGESNYVSNFLTYGLVIWKFIFLLLPNAGLLNADHHVTILQLSSPYEWLTGLMPLLGIVILIIGAINFRKKEPLVWFGILWSLMTILPYMLVNTGSAEIMVEYKFYLSIIGGVVLIALGIDTLRKKLEKDLPGEVGFICGLSMVVLLCLYTGQETRKRNKVWKNEFTLWQDTVLKSPNKARPHLYFGNELMRQNRIKEAVTLYQKALKDYPNYDSAHNSLANAYRFLNRLPEAAIHYKKSIELSPKDETIRSNYASLLEKMGRIDEALNEHNQALKINNQSDQVHFNLALTLSRMGKPGQALIHFETAVKINPKDPRYLYKLALTHKELGNLEKARIYFDQVLEMDPHFLDTSEQLKKLEN